ncbi:3-isopropylmalate dehydratase small subunit [Tyzzerella sp. OttesenSCG-928-J15]|nr:3-isopropylmalate dehydratase small subunit [Tyzzerella sp. OttesenSCG-928-J15]
MKTKGKVFKYGNDIDTDIIIPARYLNITDLAELCTFAMNPVDPDFHKNCEAGDIIAAGKNFGCGSSREHAPAVLKENGVGCIIAETFARIFYRNSINIGLPIIECEEAARDIEAGEQVEVDFGAGIITNHSKNKTYNFQPFPEFLQNIMVSGGLVKKTIAEIGN